jgi:hypothetical protein
MFKTVTAVSDKMNLVVITVNRPSCYAEGMGVFDGSTCFEERVGDLSSTRTLWFRSGESP